MPELTHYLHSAIQAALEAGRIQQTHVHGDLEIDTKSSANDLVTHVDRLCESHIRDALLAAYPEHVVLGEEQGQSGEASHRWIVDPIDGTLNYAHGFPFYCVSIGLEIDGDLVLGVVYDPVRDELFSAVRGGGAYLNGRPLTVSSETNPGNAMLATGFAYSGDTIGENLDAFARMLSAVRTVRRPGAAALDLCYVAAGRLDGFWELKLNPWDVAAGVVIVQEAGGTVTDSGGAPYQLGERVVASNGHLHGKLIALLDLEQTLA